MSGCGTPGDGGTTCGEGGILCPDCRTNERPCSCGHTYRCSCPWRQPNGWVRHAGRWLRADIVKSIRVDDTPTGAAEAIIRQEAPPWFTYGERVRFGCGDWTMRAEPLR